MQNQAFPKPSGAKKAKSFYPDIKNVEAFYGQLSSINILTPEDWRGFELFFEKFHPGYIDGLKTGFPDLSAAEMRFLVLQKLKLNNGEMSSILGVTAAAMRKTKSRLLKKYNKSAMNLPFF